MKLAILIFSLSFQVFAVGNPKAPKRGIFKRNLGTEPSTLHPLSSSDGYSSRVQAYVLEGLLKTNPDTYEFEPGLAIEWKISKDGKTFDYTLREGVKWHDGKPFSAEDVKFTFDAIMNPENKYNTAHRKPYYENIKGIEIVGKNKIRVQVKDVYFQNFDVISAMFIVPKHIYENPTEKEQKKLNRTLIGTGAYVLDKYTRGKSIKLVRNKNWWGQSISKGENNFNSILLRFVKDRTIALQRLERGDLDFMSLMTEEYMKKTKSAAWKKKVEKIEFTTKGPGGLGYAFIGWNMEHPILKSRDVRFALAHLFNRKLMIDKFEYGKAVAATGPVSVNSDYANPKVKAPTFDPKKALNILRSDGWKDTDGDRILDKMINGKKTKLSFTILEPADFMLKWLTIFKEDAKKVGVDINIKVVEWNTFLKLLDEKKFDALRMAWGAGSIHWDPKQIWHSNSIKGGSNYISYKNKKVDELIDKARVTMDKAARTKILHKVHQLISDDHPYLFYYNKKYLFYGKTRSIGQEKPAYQYDVGLGYWWASK